MTAAFSAALAEDLVAICGDLNDGFGVTHRAKNVAFRLMLPGHPRMPAGVPAGVPLVVFAGSNDKSDWWWNGHCAHVDTPFGGYHEGFEKCFQRVRETLEQVLEGYGTICWAGHSQGSTLAVRAAMHFWARGVSAPWIYTFGSPRGASKKFRDAVRKAGITIWRVVVGYDIVVRSPDRDCDFHVGKGVFFTENGDPRSEQKRPSVWTFWRYFTKSVWCHMALSSYLTAMRRAADQT
jgi:hypothetical protein